VWDFTKAVFDRRAEIAEASMTLAVFAPRWRRYGFLACTVLLVALALVLRGLAEKWHVADLNDAELDTVFFAGLNAAEIPNIPEPTNLRPCCIFGNDIGVQVGSVPVPGYEIRYVLEVGSLGTHRFNKGPVGLQAGMEKRIVSDEASGILYTCRGGFIDIAHVRDNADRTIYLASQLARIGATGGTIPLLAEGGRRRIIVKPLDRHLVRMYGVREVVTSLAEWLDHQAGIWHEIATWYGWSSTPFPERPSAFSPEDIYSNLVGARIAGTVIRRHTPPTELAYDVAVTALLNDALTKLGPLPRAATRRAFQYVDGIWWDSTKRIPDNLLVRHRSFNIGPELSPWKVEQARAFSTLPAAREEFDRYCQGDWRPLRLSVPEALGDVPFRRMATLEIEPEERLITNGFPFPGSGSTRVTQEDFPRVIAAIERAADAELGPGAGSPAARPGEESRYYE
jgi:hypothetical protein